MANFSDPKYASYITLCRRLPLVREFQEGDWYWYPGPPDGVRVADAYSRFRPDPEFWRWLPSLDDWLEMLETAGHPRIYFDPRPWTGEQWVALSHEQASPLCSTREEAAAWLWLTITQLTITQALPEMPKSGI